jgi:hypothetical protein
MLSPRRVKFRKQQRGRMRGIATRGNTISFGSFGLVYPRIFFFTKYFPNSSFFVSANNYLNPSIVARSK